MVSNPARNAAASHHAFDFELADIGPAATKMLRHADALTVAGLADCRREIGLATEGRSMATVSVIVFVPVASW